MIYEIAGCWRPRVIITCLAAFLAGILSFTGNSLAGPLDGVHDFSLDADSAGQGSAFGAAGTAAPGDIQTTVENGAFPAGSSGYFFTIPGLGTQEVDAYSYEQHPFVDLNAANPANIFDGTLDMIHSIDGDSDLYEWLISGPSALGGPRAGGFDPDAPDPNVAPAVLPAATVHDDAASMGLVGFDLDALDSGPHDPPYPEPFPDHLTDNVAYFSVEKTGPIDDGDVLFVAPLFPVGPTGIYLDDAVFAPVVGFSETEEQLDALVVFDVAGGLTSFDEGVDARSSDLILFSLAPGMFDPVGDNVYWYSAAGGGTGGLYFDPLYSSQNVDALDVHQTAVPEPTTMLLLGIGLAGLGRRARRRLVKA